MDVIVKARTRWGAFVHLTRNGKTTLCGANVHQQLPDTALQVDCHPCLRAR